MDPGSTCKFIKLLEENLCDIGQGKEILDMTPKAKSIKEKRIRKIGLHQNERLCFVKVPGKR